MQTLTIVLLTALGVFLGLILAVVVGWWWINRKFKGAISELAKFGSLANFHLQARITLRRFGPDSDLEEEGLDQRAIDAIREDAERLRAMGFEDAGQFTIEEYPTLMHAFAHPGHGAYALVTYNVAGPQGKPVTWCDVVTSYAGSSADEPGPMITHASLEDLGGDKAPWTSKAACPGLDARSLVERHLRERERMAREVTGPHALSVMSGATPLPVRAEDFRRFFEDAYAREMDYRLVRGTRPEEVRRIAAASGQKVTDEEVNATVAMTRVQYNGMLDALVIDEYKRTAGVSADELDRIEGLLFGVREGDTPATVGMRLARVMGWEEDGDKARAAAAALGSGGAPIRRAFRDYAKTLPAEMGFRQLGTVKRPVVADVYVGPEEE